jgi:hypothetical protein
MPVLVDGVADHAQHHHVIAHVIAEHATVHVQRRQYRTGSYQQPPPPTELGEDGTNWIADVRTDTTKLMERYSDGVEDQAAEEAVWGVPRARWYISFGSHLPCERLCCVKIKRMHLGLDAAGTICDTVYWAVIARESLASVDRRSA